MTRLKAPFGSRFSFLVLLLYFGLSAEGQERQSPMKQVPPPKEAEEFCQENPYFLAAFDIGIVTQPWDRRFSPTLDIPTSSTFPFSRPENGLLFRSGTPQATLLLWQSLPWERTQVNAIPKPPRGWFCRMEDGIARRLPWAIDFGTD